MKTSESIKEIAPAFAKAQAAVANTVKSAVNPFFSKNGHESKYVPLDELIPVVKSALLAEGIAFIQGAEPSEGDVLHLTTRLMHTSGEWIESTLSMKPSKADPQGIGSCITYARRYSLAAMVGVVSDDDDDANAASAPAKAAPKEKATPAAPVKTQHELAVEMVRELFQKLPEKKRNLDTMKAVLPISDFSQVKECTIEQLNTGIDRINAMLEGK